MPWMRAIRKKRPGTRRGQPTKAEKEVIRHRHYVRTGGRCELGNMPGCLKGVLPEVGSVLHRWHLVHLKSRGAGGKWDDENLRGGCHVCHLQGLHNCKGKPVPKKER